MIHASDGSLRDDGMVDTQIHPCTNPNYTSPQKRCNQLK